MKNLISVLFYTLIVFLFLSIIIPILHWPGSSISLSFGMFGLVIYFIAKTIKDIVKHRLNKINLTLQILIVLMSPILFSKYLNHSFGDYPGLIIVPAFIVMSVLYFFKSKLKYTKLSVATITYLILSIPLFGLEYYKSPIHYIPKYWYHRYGVEESASVTLGYGYKYKETEKSSIKAFKLYQAEKYDEAIDTHKNTLEIGHLFETDKNAINRHNS